MKRIITQQSKVVLVLAALVFTVGFGAGVALAQSPHFIDSKTSLTLATDGGLTVKWKESGLGDNLNIDYTFGATATVACVCATKNGSCPNAANKSKGSVAESASGTFSVKNGSVVGSLTLQSPGCPASLQPTCGGGQHFELVDLTWTDISLSDDTNTVFAGGLPESESVTGLFVCRH